MGILTDEERAEFLAHGETAPRQLMYRVAKAQYQKDIKDFIELLENIDLPSVSDFYQDPKDMDSYVYGYNDGQDKTLNAIELALKQLVEE